MNHLAHSFLSCNDQDLLMGNMLTDFVNKSEAKLIHQDFQKGIVLHRAIDRFMDSHPTTKEAIKILRPSQKKYAPVSIDLLWDYFLTHNWDKYANQTYPDFCDGIYSMLNNSMKNLPPKLKERFKKLISYDFLGQYYDDRAFQKVLLNMERRTKFKSNFTDLIKVSNEHYDDLNALFNAFFPEAIDHCKYYCDC